MKNKALSSVAAKPEKLTSRTAVPFLMVFSDRLERNYTLDTMSPRDLKAFQRFLDKVVNMSVDEVEKSFLRDPDHQDKFHSRQVYHYGVTDTFRIHGYYGSDAMFHVLRIDPKHEYHK